MTRTTYNFLRRAYEHVVSGAGALAITLLLLVTVNAQAATPRKLTPSVTVLVPTVTVLVPSVTIEVVE